MSGFASRLLIAVISMVILALSGGTAVAQDAPTPQSLNEGNYTWGFVLPEQFRDDRWKAQDPPKADILVWVPDGVERIRSMLVIPNNTDSKHFGEHDPLRAAAKKHEMAVVYLRHFNTGLESEQPTEPDRSRMTELFKWLADETDIAEFEHAPWITFGKSSRGRFPFRAAWAFPKRTIGTITYHGETPSWPIPDWSDAGKETILQVNANGESEWGGTWFVHVRPSLLNYRLHTNWLTHLMVARGVGHGDYDKGNPRKLPNKETFDYLAVFVDKALGLRVPETGYPTKGPTTLKDVEPQSGYLIDPFAVEELFEVPHLPLVKGDTGYDIAPADESPVEGYVAIPPAKDYQVADGIPVVKFKIEEPAEGEGAGRMIPRDWLITKPIKQLFSFDPMIELPDAIRTLQPKPGDTVEIDGKQLPFERIDSKHIPPAGGIALDKGLRQGGWSTVSLLGYAVLKVDEPIHVQVLQGYTAATRVQLVLNGVPVQHKQIVKLEPGLYPYLVVLRMGAKWGRIEPGFGPAGDEYVAMAKKMQAEADAYAAEQARKEAAGQADPVLIHKATTVPQEKRKHMLWVADREQAEAWFKVHAVHGQEVRIADK